MYISIWKSTACEDTFRLKKKQKQNKKRVTKNLNIFTCIINFWLLREFPEVQLQIKLKCNAKKLEESYLQRGSLWLYAHYYKKILIFNDYDSVVHCMIRAF